MKASGANGTRPTRGDHAHPEGRKNNSKQAFNRYDASITSPKEYKTNTSSLYNISGADTPLARTVKSQGKLNSLLKKKYSSENLLFSRSEESYKDFDKIFKKCLNAKTDKKARDAIDDYYFALAQCYPKNSPSHNNKEKHYQQIVAMSAKVMGFSFQLDKNSSNENKIALNMELLQQILNGSQTSEAINNQVSAVLATGLKTQEQKDFLFGTCLNIQIISVDKYDDGIRDLDRRLVKLNEQLANASGEDVEALGKKVAGAQAERDRLANEKDRLLAKEQEGMHSQKDFFSDCYSIILNQIQTDVWSDLEKQSELQGKDAKYNYDIGFQFAEEIIKKIDPILKEKAKSVAKNTANQKAGVNEQDLYHRKRFELVQLIMGEISSMYSGKKNCYDIKGVTVADDKPLPDTINNTKKDSLELGQIALDVHVNDLPNDEYIDLKGVLDDQKDEGVDLGDDLVDLEDEDVDLEDVLVDLEDEGVDLKNEEVDLKNEEVDLKNEEVDLEDVVFDLKSEEVDLRNLIIDLEVEDPNSLVLILKIPDPENGDNQDLPKLKPITIKLDDYLPPENQ